MKRGSITVFLSLLLAVCIALIMVLLEASRIPGLKTYLNTSAQSAMDSLFSAYDKRLFDRFGLLLLNTAELPDQRSPEEMLAVYLAKEADTKSGRFLLKGNFFRAELSQTKILDYQFADHRGGELFVRDVIDFMKYRTVKLGLDQFENQLDELDKGEKSSEELDENTRKSQEQSDKALSAETEERRREYEEVMQGSWLDKIKKIREEGWLFLVLPIDKVASNVNIDREELPSRYGKAAEMLFPFSLTDPAQRLMFAQYIIDRCGMFTAVMGGGELKYETEYIIEGESSDRANLEGCITSLLIMREALNLITVVKEPSLSAKTKEAAAALAGWTGLPPVIALVEITIAGAWSFAETIADLRSLLAGGRVPLIKKASEWNLSLEGAAALAQGELLQSAADTDGLCYEDYLRILVYMGDIQKMAYRLMDVIQMRIRKEDRSFDILSCAYGVTAEAVYEVRPLFAAIRPEYRIRCIYTRMY